MINSFWWTRIYATSFCASRIGAETVLTSDISCENQPVPDYLKEASNHYLKSLRCWRSPIVSSVQCMKTRTTKSGISFRKFASLEKGFYWYCWFCSWLRMCFVISRGVDIQNPLYLEFQFTCHGNRASWYCLSFRTGAKIPEPYQPHEAVSLVALHLSHLILLILFLFAAIRKLCSAIFLKIGERCGLP